MRAPAWRDRPLFPLTSPFFPITELIAMAQITGSNVIDTHDTLLEQPVARQRPPLPALPDLGFWLEENHRNNRLLWDEEDLARRTQARPEEITANKRAIDGYNQARNDAIERMDELLLLALNLVSVESAMSDEPVSMVAPGAQLNSETAGSMVDRLSIMSLKVKAMRAQTMRTDVDEAHRVSCQGKLARLQEQRRDLARCLDELMADSLAGTRYFKVYRQFKMYNDARLNPVLVAEQQAQKSKGV